MNRNQAIQYAEKCLGIDWNGYMSDYIALFRLRHTAIMLPEFGNNGAERDKCEWCLIDSAAKLDSGEYGTVYYFGEQDDN